MWPSCSLESEQSCVQKHITAQHRQWKAHSVSALPPVSMGSELLFPESDEPTAEELLTADSLRNGQVVDDRTDRWVLRLMLRWEIYIITYTATRNSFDPYTVTFQEMYLNFTELPGRLWFRDERSCQLTKLGHHHLQQKSKWSLTHEDQSKDRNQPGREAWPSSWNEIIESVFNEPGSSPSRQQLLHYSYILCYTELMWTRFWWEMMR